MIPRFPVFVLGMLTAAKNFEPYLKYILPSSAVMLIAAILVTYKYHIWWNLVIVCGGTLFLCYIIALLGRLAKKVHIYSPIEFFGKYSLQIYMVHQPIFFLLSRFVSDHNGVLLLVASIALSAVAAYVLKVVSECIILRKKAGLIII